MRRLDFAKVIRRLRWDGVAAIRAGCHIGTNGHAARVAGDLVAVVVPFYRARSEAHGRSPFFASRYYGLASCFLPKHAIFRSLCNCTSAVLFRLKIPTFLFQVSKRSAVFAASLPVVHLPRGFPIKPPFTNPTQICKAFRLFAVLVQRGSSPSDCFSGRSPA